MTAGNAIVEIHNIGLAFKHHCPVILLEALIIRICMFV